MRGSLLLMLFVGVARAEPPDGRLHFTEHGFSIASPKGHTDEQSSIVILYLPASDGFGPNVNVQLQPFGGTMAEYLEMSKKQFTQMGLKTIQLREDQKGSAIVEYAGPMQGKNLHFYARAVKAQGKIYLVTGTASEAQWPKTAEALKASVTSFQLDR